MCHDGSNAPDGLVQPVSVRTNHERPDGSSVPDGLVQLVSVPVNQVRCHGSSAPDGLVQPVSATATSAAIGRARLTEWYSW